MPYETPSLDVLSIPYGNLEIPSAGGATVPAHVPTRASMLRDLLSSGRTYPAVGNISQRMKQHIVNRRGQQPCDCGPQQPGQPAVPQGFQAPLVQGPNPLKPFETPQNPCSPTHDALLRQGITPQQLADCLQPHMGRTRSLTPRRPRRKRAVSSRTYMKRRAAYAHGPRRARTAHLGTKAQILAKAQAGYTLTPAERDKLGGAGRYTTQGYAVPTGRAPRRRRKTIGRKRATTRRRSSSHTKASYTRAALRGRFRQGEGLPLTPLEQQAINAGY